MMEIFDKLKNKVIISAQASAGEPIYEDRCLTSIIKSVISGGAGGLRLAGAESIRETRKLYDIPVIGITKPDPLPENWRETVYITPTFRDAKEISEAGTDIIAIDGTGRHRPEENLPVLISRIKTELYKPVMADISTLEEGINCAKYGVDIVSTTLSGYTSYTSDKNNGQPDFMLLEKLVNTLNIHVILEGRIWTPEHVRQAFKIGAFAVVIGSAVTRPQVITRRFADAVSD